jgi:diacylglycerol kinase (ATP)
LNIDKNNLDVSEDATGYKQKNRTDTVMIVNPKSASGSTGKGWDSLYAKIKDSFGANLEVAFTKKAGDGTMFARNFLKKDFKNIVAIGGDGTINEVANGFFEKEEDKKDITETNDHQLKRTPFNAINSEATLIVLPCGTRNVLVKSLNLPCEIEACCKNFAKCNPKKIDVIRASATNPSNRSITESRIFLNAAEMGVAAEIIDRSKKIRAKVKSRIVSTVSSIVATMPTYQSNLCEIIIDDGRENILTKMTMGVVANGKYLGGGFKAAPNANVSDGLLDLVILKNSGSFKMLEEFMSMKNGNYDNKGDIYYKLAKKVEIKPKEDDKRGVEQEGTDIIVTVDGEPIGILPATFQVIESALAIRM